MDKQKEIEISKHQPAVFMSGTEMGELYKAMFQYWGRTEEQRRSSFMASLFYGIGRVHGVREERARRKRK